MLLRQACLQMKKSQIINTNALNLQGAIRASTNASNQVVLSDNLINSSNHRPFTLFKQPHILYRHPFGYNQHILRTNEHFKLASYFHTSHNNGSDIKNSQKKEENNLSIFKRFKLAYKEYGQVMIGVHLMTSAVWYGSFVFAVHSGIDITPLLEYIGTSQGIIDKITSSGAGDFAIAYLMYKIATPVRYATTLAGTQLTAKQLRKRGYMKKPSEEDSLRNLMKEGHSKAKVKMDEGKEKLKHSVDDGPEKLKHHMEDGIGKMKHHFEDSSGKMKERIGNHEGIGKMKHRLEDTTGKLKESFHKHDAKMSDQLGQLVDKYMGGQTDATRAKYQEKAQDLKENLFKKTEFSKSKFAEDLNEVKDVFKVDRVREEISSAARELKKKISPDNNGFKEKTDNWKQNARNKNN